MTDEERSIQAVDLFCGVGGFTHGLERAGVDVVAGADIEPRCEVPYEANNESVFYERDLAKVAQEEPEWVESLYSDSTDVRVLAGGPPCQPYSNLNNGKEDHEKSGLITAFAEIVEEVRPDIVAMENVYGVRNDEEYERLLEIFTDAGYYVNDSQNRRVACLDYGIPQQRKRWITLASLEGPIELDSPSRTDVELDPNPTVEKFIGDLPNIKAGCQDEDDPLHAARDLNDTNLQRIEISEPGGDWTDWKEKGREDLVADCHKEDSGKSYKAPYSRIRGDRPGPTITTQFYNYGSGRFGHYDTDQNRALSIREGAILQTFPDDYRFLPGEEIDDVGFQRLGRWIGNAVPPKLAEVIGASILRHINGFRQMTVVDFTE
ncbi:DNA cytosine methyltransferase [Haloarcula pellucida]|uniref:DNA (cytosine-5-)-methyltransferase n=1 Tax=Haloarcula pellucida TaxID=1427151 RepID=A0A830GMJ8_9EURY|nr:DNA cytosine methyltransferase [Halomicroarcula pellucida]MBX0349012.1 DNA cytosine methyltransferase [Halomicroarcula pellucida]GGN98606.1 cytosine-specific methyltransferase [Halomicroarcula pellucida]